MTENAKQILNNLKNETKEIVEQTRFDYENSLKLKLRLMGTKEADKQIQEIEWAFNEYDKQTVKYTNDGD